MARRWQVHACPRLTNRSSWMAIVLACGGRKNFGTPSASSSAARSTRYIAKKGDTLVTVADRFNVSVDQLRSWNHLKGTALTPGHSLYVSEPARVASPHGHRHGKSSSGTAGTGSGGKASHSGTGAAHSAAAKSASSTSKTAHANSAPKGKTHHSSAP